MSIPGELVYFLLLTRDQQATAIRRMSSQGWSDHAIAGATHLGVEDVRRVLGEKVA